MDKPQILVTNDDGPDSPFLPPLLDRLSEHMRFRNFKVLIPSEEKSWVSHAISRFSPLHTSEATAGRHAICTLSGTPADCAAIGLEHMSPTRFELLLSGINIGSNAGLPFFLHSGTVAAARQAALMNTPAIALSAEVPIELFDIWRRRSLDELGGFIEKKPGIVDAAISVVEKILGCDGFSHADFYSVNIPWGARADTGIRITRPASGYYDHMFIKTGDDEYRHEFTGLSRTESASSSLSESSPGAKIDTCPADPCELPIDIEALDEGRISVTPVRCSFGRHRPQEIEALCREIDTQN